MACLLVFAVLVAFVAVGSQGFTVEERLHDQLFRGYHKYVLPQRRNASDVKHDRVEFEFAVFLKSIGEVDRVKEEIEFDFMGYFEWHDYRLTWDPKSHGDITYTYIPGQRLWKPDVVVYNSVHNSNYFFLTHEGPDHPVPLAILYHTGKVLYIPPFRTRARCDFEAAGDGAFRCTLQFGSWTANGNQMEITIHDHKDKVDITRYHGKNWQVLDSTLRPVDYFHLCCTESYPYMEVNITMKAIQ